jgi:transcriptional regulator with XRE-family HTH domain
MDIRSLVGKNVRGARQKGGLTQEQLALEAEINHGHLSEIEAGRHNVTIELLEKLAKVLKVDIADFFDSYNAKK